MKRTILFAFALAALAGCERGVPAPPTPPEAPFPDAPPPIEPPGPAAEAAPRFVGRWAAASLGCDYPAWRFEADRLDTAGEVSCRFEDVEPTPTGYAIQANCLAEGMSQSAVLKLDFRASPAGGMEIAGGPFAAPVDLIPCGGGTNGPRHSTSA